MVESLKELNCICQKPRYKEVGNWMVRHIIRDAALPLTWVLLHTQITANQVTFASLIVALSGIVMFVFPFKFVFLIGVLFLQLWYLLDHVDGQIARYRKTAGLTGRFFDFMAHHIVHGAIFFALSVYCFQTTSKPYFMIWGFIASACITLFNLINDTKYKTFFEKLITLSNIVITPENRPTIQKGGEQNLLHQISSLMHKLCEIHVLMNILTAAATVEFFFSPLLNLRVTLFIIYGLMVPLLTSAKIAYLIISGDIDREFDSIFKSEE